ncbi:MAG: adenylyltransferase/cytidyltransferase family protein [Cyanobacteria bacterium REEB494]|nr:adenylyltransferase/cytidyltransferase family protein [Cyanobacteria bacterium REEB494]
MQPHLSHRTVFVSGNFNILHPGHLRLLRFAKECGDRLIVAVQSDRMAGKAAHVTEHYRLEKIPFKHSLVFSRQLT